MLSGGSPARARLQAADKDGQQIVARRLADFLIDFEMEKPEVGCSAGLRNLCGIDARSAFAFEEGAMVAAQVINIIKLSRKMQSGLYNMLGNGFLQRHSWPLAVVRTRFS